jgi:hypothetical protein
MILKSEIVCPKDKRSVASKETLIKALEASEKQLHDFYSNPSAKAYISMRNNVQNVIDEIDNIFKEAKLEQRRVLNGEDKTFDKISNFWKAQADLDDTLERLRKKTTPEDILEAEKQAEGTQSIVELVRNKANIAQTDKNKKRFED